MGDIYDCNVKSYLFIMVQLGGGGDTHTWGGYIKPEQKRCVKPNQSQTKEVATWGFIKLWLTVFTV